MNDPAVRAIAIRAILAGALLAGAWHVTVRPARAGVEEQRTRLQTSHIAVTGHHANSLTEEQASAMLTDLHGRAEELGQMLARHASSTDVLRTIERMSNDRGLRLQRTDPRTGQRGADRRSGREGEPSILQDEFTIDFIGDYAATTAFIGDLQYTVGPVQITEVRLTRSGRNAVRATVNLVVHRAQPGSRVINFPPEARHAS